MFDQLQQSAIQIYDTRPLPAALQPDFVVVGNAMSRGHPEVRWLSSPIKLTCLYQVDRKFLSHQSIRCRDGILLISTTALIAFLLQQAVARDS